MTPDNIVRVVGARVGQRTRGWLLVLRVRDALTLIMHDSIVPTVLVVIYKRQINIKDQLQNHLRDDAYLLTT